MKKDRYIIIILLTVALLFLGLFYFIINDNRKLTIIEIVIKEPVLFVQKIALKPIKIISEEVDELKERKGLQKRLKDQEKKLETYNLLENELEQKDKQLEELQSLLEVKVNFSNYEVINASVVNRNVGYWYQTFTIDKGKNDGVENNSAVVTSKGLIGKIIKVTPNSSVVKLLTSAGEMFQIAVLIENEGESIFGILSGYKNNEFIITGLSYNKEIKENSIVTTSGLDNIFPSGLLIGEVVSSKKDDFDLEQIVYVKPSSSFDDINYVSILKRSE